MLTRQARYRAAEVFAFRSILAAWLAAVPPEGWEGTIGELETALETAKAEQVLRGWIPRANALGVRIRCEMRFLEDRGFTVEFHRTATARTIRVFRTPVA